MTVRRFLLYTPILLILFLVQSYFWIPSFEQQSRGNPDRLDEFINASIGDASILNPILSADAPSSQINALVFEGLIDRDADLRLGAALPAHGKSTRRRIFILMSRCAYPAGDCFPPPPSLPSWNMQRPAIFLFPRMHSDPLITLKPSRFSHPGRHRWCAMK